MNLGTLIGTLQMARDAAIAESPEQQPKAISEPKRGPLPYGHVSMTILKVLGEADRALYGHEVVERGALPNVKHAFFSLTYLSRSGRMVRGGTRGHYNYSRRDAPWLKEQQ